MKSRLFILLSACLLLASCTAGQPQGMPVLTDADPPALLPVLAQLERSSSVTGEQLTGSQFSVTLSNQGASVQGDACLLESTGMSTADVAWAIYDFSLPDYDGSGQVALEFASPAAGMYLAFSNFSSQRWEFHQAAEQAQQTVGFGDPAEYISASGRFLVALFLTGDATAVLDRLTIGTPPTGNEPPLAVLSVDNIYGDAPFTVNYDAAGSSDPDGSITLYELDLDDDGTYEISQVAAPSGMYDVLIEGSYPLKLRVTDDEGATAETTVVVSAGASWQPNGATFPFADTPYALIDFNAGGMPLIVYASVGGKLHFTRAGDALGETWPNPGQVLDDTGPPGSFILARINGRPALAYEMEKQVGEDEEETARFVIADDAAGTSWSSPVEIPLSELFPKIVSLAEVDGHPAVLMQQFVSGEDSGNFIYFSRATDPQGSAWTAPVKVSDLDVTGEYQSNMYVHEGVPCVVFAHTPDGSPDGELRISRAVDSLGSSWHPDELVLQTGLGIGFSPLLTELGDRLCIVHADFDNVYVLRAADAEADSWEAPQNIATCELATAFEVHDSFGHPALSWSDLTPHNRAEVVYMRALDSSGESWPTSPNVVAFVTENVSSSWYSPAQTGVLGGLPVAFTYHPADSLKLSSYK